MPFHDSRDPAYRSPAGARPCGGAVRLRLRVPEGTSSDARLRVWDGGQRFYPMQAVAGDASLYEAVLRLPDTPRLLWYDFQLTIHGHFYWYGNAEDGLGGVGAPIYSEARSFQITVYDPAFTAPDWTRGAVWYQIFPDRFARGADEPVPEPSPDRTVHARWDEAPALQIDPVSGDNVAHDFLGGTLRGIRDKLGYLASLGVTVLYLNPIFRATTNHRFDTVDWRMIDPMLGTQEDFATLCEAARAAHIRIVLDGVFSHSSDRNPFFIDAKNRADSPYRLWYHFEHWPDVYKSWWGFPTLPDLNKECPDVIDYFLTGPDAIAARWPRAGTDGWRLDVADELPMPYLRRLRETVQNAKRDAIVIGEVWEDASNKISYGEMRCYCLGDTLDGVMNYPLRDAAVAFLTGRIDAAAFKRRMDSLYENYPAPFAASLLNVIGSHDRPRVLNVLAGRDGEELPREARGSLRLTNAERTLGKKRLLTMLALIVAMPGMPCVYYGDECGMEGAADPFNRAPMAWDSADVPLRAAFADALARRRRVAALSDGALTLEVISDDVLAVVRADETETAVTVINRADTPANVTIAGQTILVPPVGTVCWETWKH